MKSRIEQVKKYKVVSIFLGGIVLIPLVWFFVFNFELKFISSPFVNFFLDKAGIKNYQYEIVSINKKEVHLRNFEADDLSFRKLLVNYGLNGKVNSFELNDTLLSVLLDKEGRLLKPIQIPNHVKDEQNIKNKNENILEDLVSNFPDRVSVKNFRIQHSINAIKGEVSINLNLNRKDNTLITLLKIEGEVMCPCPIPNTDKLKSVQYNSVINAEITPESISIINSSMTIKPVGNVLFSTKNEVVKILSDHIKLKIISAQFNAKKNILKNLSLNLNPLDLSLFKEAGNLDLKLGVLKLSSELVKLSDLKNAEMKIILDESKASSKDVNISSLKLGLKGSFNKTKINLLAKKIELAATEGSDSYITPVELSIKGYKNKEELNISALSSVIEQRNVKLKADLKYDLSSSQGHLSVNLPTLELDNESFSLRNVSPFAAKENLKLRGNLGFSAEVPISDRPIKGSLNIVLKDFSVIYNDIELSYLNSNLSLLNLKKPRTSDLQSVEINRIKIGQTVENIKFNWMFDSRKLLLSNLSGELLGGSVKVAQLELNPLTKRIDPFEIKLSKLDLFKVLSIGLDKGLEAEGQISGHITVKMNEEGRPYLNGKLSTVDQGVIKYDTQVTNDMAQKADQSVGIMVRYMKNMHYDNLDILLESDENYNLNVLLNLMGKNPEIQKLDQDLLDLTGKPLKLKLNLDLNIMKAIKSYLLAFELPKKIEENLINSLDIK